MVEDEPSSAHGSTIFIEMCESVWFFIVSLRKRGGKSALNAEIPYVFIIFHGFFSFSPCVHCFLYIRNMLYPMESVSHFQSFHKNIYVFDFHNPSSYVVFLYGVVAVVVVPHVSVNSFSFEALNAVSPFAFHVRIFILSNESHKIENSFSHCRGTPSFIASSEQITLTSNGIG